MQSFKSVDPLADAPANISWSPYTYVWNNPINAIDPDGRHGEWVPELDENSNLILRAEEGDNYSSLRKFLGKDNILNLDAGQLYTKYQEMENSGSGSINFGTDNVISQTNMKLGKVASGELSGSINCFDCAQLSEV